MLQDTSISLVEKRPKFAQRAEQRCAAVPTDFRRGIARCLMRQQPCRPMRASCRIQWRRKQRSWRMADGFTVIGVAEPPLPAADRQWQTVAREQTRGDHRGGGRCRGEVLARPARRRLRHRAAGRSAGALRGTLTRLQEHRAAALRRHEPGGQQGWQAAARLGARSGVDRGLRGVRSTSVAGRSA